MWQKACSLLVGTLYVGTSTAAQAAVRFEPMPPCDPVPGVVRDVRGEPVGGARVEVWYAATPDLRRLHRDHGPEWRALPSATTRADGGFVVHVPRFGPTRLRVSHEHHADHRWSGYAASREFDIRLDAARTVTGSVTMAHDGGAAAATVHAFARDTGERLGQARTDGDGRFRIDGLPPQPVELSVDAPSAVPPGDVVVDLTDGAVEHAFVLSRGLRLRGRVHQKDGGAVVAGATLHAGWHGAVLGRTNERGFFDVFGVVSARELHIAAEGLQRLCVTPTEPSGVQHLGRLELATGTVARGRVVDVEGRPVAGVPVCGVGFESTTGTYHRYVSRGVTAADGTFELRGLGYDETIPTLVAGGVGGLARVVRGGRDKRRLLEFGDVCIEPAKRVHGQLVDAAGAPVVGVRVVLFGTGGSEPFVDAVLRSPATIGWVLGGRECVTDHGGCFALSDLPSGDYVIDVRRQGAAGLHERLAVGDESPGPLRLQLR